MLRPFLLGSVLLLGCASQVELRQGFATVNGARLYFEQAGSGPDLVLIQGGQLDGRMWDPQFEAFAESHRARRPRGALSRRTHRARPRAHASQAVRTIVLSGPGLSGFDGSDDGSWDAIERASEAGDAHAAAEARLLHPYMAPSMERPELRERLHALALDNAQVWVRADSELPDVERVDIQGGGHMLNLEDPERFNALVFDFLRSSSSPLLPGASGDRP